MVTVKPIVIVHDKVVTGLMKWQDSELATAKIESCTSTDRVHGQTADAITNVKVPGTALQVCAFIVVYRHGRDSVLPSIPFYQAQLCITQGHQHRLPTAF